MVDEELDRTFSALGDGTRRAILARLCRGSATVTELAEPFDISLNAVSKHLQVLERAGLIRREVQGRRHHCSLNPMPIHDANEWTAQFRVFWEQRLDALDGYLRERRGRRRRR